MPTGYLVLASEQRVIEVTFDNEPPAIQQAIGCQTCEHGTTFGTEDQLLVNGNLVAEMPAHRFYASGEPFPFVGNALSSAAIRSMGALQIGRR
jgi:hypothetical protein